MVAGVGAEKLLMVAAWYEDPRFDDAERAALALTEAMTRLADRPGAVTDEIWPKPRSTMTNGSSGPWY